MSRRRASNWGLPPERRAPQRLRTRVPTRPPAHARL